MKDYRVPEGVTMEKINGFARRELTPEEVYVFPVVLCDNEVDRDNERFSIPALEKLAELFVGKTGIFDHDPAASGQTSRIFETELITDPERVTSAGEPYTFIRAGAYLMRSEQNCGLIAEIDGGIKKEVSVSCQVEEERCSVCGKDRRKEKCPHRKGEIYGGKLCHSILEKPVDAYEWSFVAVPAQKNAGVSKSAFSKRAADEKEVEALRKQVSGLLRNCDVVLKTEILRGIVAKYPPEELELLKSRLEKRLASRVEPQLTSLLKKKASDQKSCSKEQFIIK